MRAVVGLVVAVLAAACSSPATPAATLDVAGDTLPTDVTSTADIASDTTGTAAQCPGGGGCACTTDGECTAKHCLADETGAKTCARACDRDLCPAGYGCGALGGKAVCIPRRVNLCEPCLKDDSECAIDGLPGAACVKYGNMGAFCGTPCLGDGDCGSGLACRSVERIEGGQTQQCVRVDGGGALTECACSKRAIAGQKSTVCGVTDGAHTCAGTRACGASGLSACSARTPAAETCDGVDNDCNGATDEGTCVDGNMCTDDSCGGAAGCSHPFNTAACSDGNICTVGDACAGGTCTGKPKSCDDGNACTDDAACDPSIGCGHTANTAACSDGDGCTVGDACSGGVCLPGAATVCNDGNGCTADACTAGGCVYTPATGGICNDNDACTLADACSEGTCTGKAANCDDGNPCSADSCDPATGCVHTDASGPCDDGNPCTDGDACAGGGCFGTLKICVSPGPCLVASCSPVAGGCAYTLKSDGTTCNDGNACTTNDACVSGGCAGIAANCSDGNPCTSDSCSAVSGCGHVANTGACDDANPCTHGDSCATGACLGTAINCDDGKTCTDDSCAANGTCTHTNHVGTCDDGQPCTSGDTCTAGVCAGLTATNCDDGNPCTDDSCDPATGCKHAPNSTASCDLDANLCTPDSCLAGVCTAAAAKVCNDGLSCTTDGCDKTTGSCTFTPVTDGTSCDDSNKCTSPDACKAGVCVGGLPATSVTTYAGQGTAGGADNSNSQVATFSGPRSIALDASGNVYVADTGNFKVRKIDSTGAVTTFAGEGIAGYQEGVGALARFRSPQAVVVAGTGLFVSDSAIQNIRAVASDQTTSLVAGLAVDPAFPAQANTGGFQDGAAANALFSTPIGLAWKAASNTLFVADQANNRIRVIDIAGSIVSTLVGNGTAGATDGALASATLNLPTGLWLSSDGTKLYFTDMGSDLIRLVDLSASSVTTLAGSGAAGAIDGANLTAASFNAPTGLTGDGTTLWIADSNNHRVRTVSATATSTLTGSVKSPFVNGAFNGSTFNTPSGILWASPGVWYVADTKNNRIRKLLDPNAGCVP